MPAFPTNLTLRLESLSESFGSVLARADMERGPAKQRRVNSYGTVTQQLAIYFSSAAQAAAFLAWYKTDIRAGADYFDFKHLRTGATVQARCVGPLGELRGLSRDFAHSFCTLTIEWQELMA